MFSNLSDHRPVDIRDAEKVMRHGLICIYDGIRIIETPEPKKTERPVKERQASQHRSIGKSRRSRGDWS